MATGSKQAPQPQFLIAEVSRTGLTFASGSYLYASFKDTNSDIVKDGYTAIGIVGWKITGTNATLARVNAVYLESSTEARVYMTNTSSSSGSYNVYLHVLYIKN